MLFDDGARWHPTSVFAWVQFLTRCPSRTLVQKWISTDLETCWVVVPQLSIEELAT